MTEHNHINENPFIHDLRPVPVPGLPEASLLRCRFTPAHYHDGLLQQLGLALPPALHAAVGKRKAEYLAGRHLSKLMLDAQGLPGIVPTGAHREPLWPAGWVGSITHAAGIAMSCIVRQSDIALLGIDLEAWMDGQLANDIAHSVIDAQEREVLAGPWHFSRELSLAFSAKESFFKAAFPVVGRYFDFNCVRLTDVDYAGQRFRLQVAEPLAPSLPPGHVVEGSFLYDDETVFTVVAQRPR